MEVGKKPLVGMNLLELKNVAKELGMPAFTGGQMAKWLYTQHVTSIDEMTNISKDNREKLKENYTIGCKKHIDAQYSKDGTIKYLFPTDNGKFVESVYIPDENRATLCVSSQVGCKMNCLFCQTGKQGFEGNLTTADILNQIYSLPEREKLTNIVFMGQGEPMDNYDNVLKTTQLLTADYAYAWSPKRITVSSIGIKSKLKRFLEESDCHVAISMHNPIPEERIEVMPSEKAMSITEIVEMLRNYDFSHQRRLSFEYIVFKGKNDSVDHAKAIIKLVEGLECRFNLIRFHTIPNVPLQGVDNKKMEEFRNYLTAHGVFTTIRASRGQDIFAACGLLSTAKRMPTNMRKLQWLCYLVLFLTLMACNENSLKPTSYGKPYEVLIVGDRKNSISNVLSSPMNGLPQAEPTFDVIKSAADTLNGDEKLLSNIVIIKIGKQYKTTELSSQQDVYARQQIVVTITSPTEKAYMGFVKQQGEKLRNYFIKAELKRAQNELVKHSNKEAEAKIQQMFGIKVKIPPDMTASKVGKDFLWLSNNSPSSMQNMCFYTIHATNFRQQCDSVMRKNIQGERKGMYMRTAAITETTQNKGKSVTIRGLWEMKDDAMGGPFIAYWKENGGTIIVSEAFIYAPGRKT